MIRDQAAAIEGSTPYLRITTDDNLQSSVVIHGSFEDPEVWTNGIFHNSNWFIIFITPPGNERYYDPERHQKLTLEMSACSYNLKKLRKYTGPIDKILPRIVEWIEKNRPPDTNQK